LHTFNQNNIKGFKKYIENQYWEYKWISFGTFHTVGGNNNFKVEKGKNEEFYDRDKANINWIYHTFNEAEKKGSKGVVLFTQAAMDFNPDVNSGYYNIIQKLKTRVEKFDLPVLLVYGDFHRFLIDKPLKSNNGKLLENFTSLMVFGDLNMHAVKIDVDLKKKSLFNYAEFWIEGN